MAKLVLVEVFNAGYDHGYDQAQLDEGTYNTATPCKHGRWCPKLKQRRFMGARASGKPVKRGK